MGVNKVDLSTGETLIDLTNDTVTKETLAEGATAHGADGEPIKGEMKRGQPIDSGQCGDNVYWKLYENGLLAISGSGAIYDYSSSISGYSPFKNREDVTDIIIKEGITSIGAEVFYSCTNLKNVVIPEGVTYIDAFAFGYCSSLESITFPNSLTDILFSAFYGCTNLTTVLYKGSKEDWDKVYISSSNDAIINAVFHCEYDPNADTVDGWHVNVLSDGSDPENITVPTITFVYTKE